MGEAVGGVAELSASLGELKGHLTGSPSLSADELAAQEEILRAHQDAISENAVILTEAFDLVSLYEETEGPLFINRGTKDGFSRFQTGGDELVMAHAMFTVQQALIDQAYTPARLVKYRQVLEGASFQTSSYFPGAVNPPADPDTIHEVQINASQPTAWGCPVSGRQDSARRPTGCYLAPGSMAVVTVPASLVDKGYAVRVGAHSWDLKKKRIIKRLDRVSLVYPIQGAQTLIANPLGGGIYIEVPYEADAGLVQVAIKNAVRSPFFSARSFDRTTLAQWKQTERRHPGPWADFESDKFMMQVPRSWVDALADPVALMQDWDKAMDAVSKLFGHPLVRSKTVLYLQVDVTMRGNANFPGYPQSNYPYNPHKPEVRRHQWMAKGPQFSDWTVLHEVGHSQLFSKFKGETEAVVNLPYVAVMNRKFGVDLDTAFGNSVSGMKRVSLDQAAIMWMVTENFRQGRPMNISNRPGDEVKYQHRGHGKYVEVARLFGWDALGRFWLADNENYQPGDPSPQNADPTDSRILRMSRAAGADLTPSIHFWGIQPKNPEALAAAMLKEGLKPSRTIHDRLQHYKTIVPMDNAEFKAHCNIVYPQGLRRPKNPLYGEGWYQVWLPKYNSSHGEAVQSTLQSIIDLYFPNGVPKASPDQQEHPNHDL